MRSFVLFLVLSLASPAAAQTGNTGLAALDRRDQVLGWEAVGRVDIASNGFCTGTLIATNLVLTAAHCLFDSVTAKPVDPRQITFRAGLRGEKVIASGQVIRAVAHPGYTPGEASNAKNVRHDLALLELVQPIPAAQAAPFAVRPAGKLDKVSVVSYARGREDTLSWQRVCTVNAQSQGLIQFDCDVTFGSSGAPVFDLSGNRAQIVSIVSSGHREGNTVSAFGMELPSLLADLKSALNSGKGVMIAQGDAPRAQIRRITVGGSASKSADQGRNTSAKFLRP
jgi:protease YdgD